MISQSGAPFQRVVKVSKVSFTENSELQLLAGCGDIFGGNENLCHFTAASVFHRNKISLALRD